MGNVPRDSLRIWWGRTCDGGPHRRERRRAYLVVALGQTELSIGFRIANPDSTDCDPDPNSVGRVDAADDSHCDAVAGRTHSNAYAYSHSDTHLCSGPFAHIYLDPNSNSHTNPRAHRNAYTCASCHSVPFSDIYPLPPADLNTAPRCCIPRGKRLRPGSAVRLSSCDKDDR